MKSVPSWVFYSVYRILLFAVPLAVLLLMQINPWVATLLAAVIGLCLSYILLRKPREGVARDLYEARNRQVPAQTPDADTDAEDAALDAREGRREASEGRREASEGQRDGEQDPVSESGETGEFQGKDQLP